MTDLFIFAGEVSGDLHGEKLLENLYKIDPAIKVAGVGGPKMRAQGMDCVMPMESFQVMGFIDVFLALPKLIRQFYTIRKTILKLNPKAVLFIDYPGFNLRMAEHLRKKRFSGKLCHYICPSVWAWGKKRIPLMAGTLDLLLSILPFEATYFAETSLEVAYVGHPLIQRLKEYPYEPLSVPPNKTVISLFPGSRTKEIERNFRIQLKTAKRLLASHPHLIFGVSVSHPRFKHLIDSIIKEMKMGDEVFLVEASRTYDLMKASGAAIAKSGTVTLELALHHVPTVVIYGISPLDLFIAKQVLKIRLPFYCLVNIIAGREVFPELIGPALTEEALFSSIEKIIADKTKEECRKQCEEVRGLLQTKDASGEAAAAIINLIRPNYV